MDDINVTNITHSIRDNKDIVISINHGLDEYGIEFIHQIEEHIDEALGSLGFTRSTSSIASNYVQLVYYQFAAAL